VSKANRPAESKDPYQFGAASDAPGRSHSSAGSASVERTPCRARSTAEMVGTLRLRGLIRARSAQDDTALKVTE